MKTTFIYTGKASTWIRLLLKGFLPEFRYLPRYLSFFMTSFLTLPLRSYENFKFGKAIQDHTLPRDPVFIIGHMRSGTTHLHNLLAQDPGFGYPDSFAAYSPEFFLSSAKFILPLLKRVAPRKREMDNMEIAAHLPQEEEFSMFALCPYSFFFHMFFPKSARYFFTRYNLFQNRSETEILQWKKYYTYLIRKFSYASGGRQLVIKNPVNTGRINVLHQLFPDARYIVLSRNPYDVYLSTRHLYEKLLPICQLQSVSDKNLDRMILEFYARQMTKLFSDLKHIPGENLVFVKYEELIDHPLDVLNRIYGQVVPGRFDAAEPCFTAYLKSIASYQRNQFPVTRETIAKVNSHWSFVFEKLGYPRLDPV